MKLFFSYGSIFIVVYGLLLSFCIRWLSDDRKAAALRNFCTES